MKVTSTNQQQTSSTTANNNNPATPNAELDDHITDKAVNCIFNTLVVGASSLFLGGIYYWISLSQSQNTSPMPVEAVPPIQENDTVQDNTTAMVATLALSVAALAICIRREIP